MSANPDAIAVFGSSDINVRAIAGLRSAGYTGLIGVPGTGLTPGRARDPRRRRRGPRSSSAASRPRPATSEAIEQFNEEMDAHGARRAARRAWPSTRGRRSTSSPTSSRELDTIDSASIVAALDDRPVDLGVAPPFTIGRARQPAGPAADLPGHLPGAGGRGRRDRAVGRRRVPRRERLRLGLSALTELLRFVLLGLGVGAVYALTGQGLVLIYRGSGVVNFAQGAFAMIGAFIYYRATGDRDWSPALAWVVAVGVPAAARRRSPTCSSWPAATRLVARARRGDARRVLPRDRRRQRGVGRSGHPGAVAAADHARGASSARAPPSPRTGSGSSPSPSSSPRCSSAVFRWTRFGHATDAAAENPVAAAALGYSPGPHRHRQLGARRRARRRRRRPRRADPLPQRRRPGVHRAARPGRRARRLVPLVLVDARRRVRHRRRRVDPQPLHRGQGRLRPARRPTTGSCSASSPRRRCTARSRSSLIVVVMVVGGRSLPLRSTLLDRLPAVGTGRVSRRRRRRRRRRRHGVAPAHRAGRLGAGRC